MRDSNVKQTSSKALLNTLQTYAIYIILQIYCVFYFCFLQYFIFLCAVQNKIMMRYLGSKALMLDNIQEVINQCTQDVRTVMDVFAGTGTVSRFFKEQRYSVLSNDILYCSYVLNRGVLEMDSPISARLRETIDHLNHLSVENSPWFDIDTAFIYRNYSPHEDCERMYFQCNNALKIDLIRQEIERLRKEVAEPEYYYLLSLLLNAVPYVSNITGTYGAYLKYWDKRTSNQLLLKEIDIQESDAECCCYNQDATEFARQAGCDLAYLDPPYNGRQYMSNYHILETIAKYDNPEIKGITGVRVDPDKMSDFCKKNRAEAAFRELLGSLNCRYILLSYNNEGLLNTDVMSQVVRDSGNRNTFRLFEYDYRRYKNKIPNNAEGLKEQLYLIEK